MGTLLLGSDLTDATISETDLDRALLCLTTLPDGTVSECELDGKSLFDKLLMWLDLTEASLSGADLRGANLGGANLSGVRPDWGRSKASKPE